VIVLSNTIAQTIQPGQSLTFNNVVMHTGCAECHRDNTGYVLLKALGGIYECSFGANIGSTAPGDAQLSIAINGSPILETTMISTTAAAGDLNRVSSDTAIRTCCGNAGESITVINTGTTEVTVGADPCLFIKRIA